MLFLLSFLLFFFVGGALIFIIGFLQGKDFLKYLPNILGSPPNPSLVDVIYLF